MLLLVLLSILKVNNNNKRTTTTLRIKYLISTFRYIIFMHKRVGVRCKNNIRKKTTNESCGLVYNLDFDSKCIIAIVNYSEYSHLCHALLVININFLAL